MFAYPRIWRSLPSVVIAVFMVIPISCVLASAVQVDPGLWQRLWSQRVPGLMANSLMLVFTVGAGALVLGGFLAFLVERADLPLKRILRPLFVAPLIIPCYIVAICYINFFGVKGLGEKLLTHLGFPIHLPGIYGFWGAALILILGAYPYVYTIVAASLSRLDPTFSEAARCLGAGRIDRLFYLTLPLLVPALSAGAVLAALYVLSDFGVVSLLRYPTFVSAIYEQMSGRYNYAAAAALSSLLVVLTLGLFVFQGALIQRRQYSVVKSKAAPSSAVKLGVFRMPALIFSLMIIMIGLVVPLGILIYWTGHAFGTAEDIARWSTPFTELLRSGLNSLSVSAGVAFLAVILALPPAYWTVRRPASIAGRILSWTAQSGVALPGVLIALGLSLVFSRLAPKLNFSILALALAFLVHFFAQALQMIQAGLTQISQRLEEGARLLGCSTWTTFWRVSRPLLKPALVSAWILVFLSSMRELPAALLLRPAGFDPLTVKIWIAASDGFYEQAALPALLLVVLSLPLVVIIHKTRSSYQASE